MCFLFVFVFAQDGTILPKAPGNTIENNFSKSAAIHGLRLAQAHPITILQNNANFLFFFLVLFLLLAAGWTEIKHLLESRCPVAVNTGNQALLQIQRILRGFSTADCYLLPRLLLCAQGGTVAYRFALPPSRQQT